MESKLANRLSLYADSQPANKSNQKDLKIMKTKFYWVALLASAAMIAQANAGGRYGGGGGGLATRVAPARAAVPSFNSAASRSFGSDRMVYSGQRFSPSMMRSPSSPPVRQYYINANAGTRQFARATNRADRPARFSNGGNRTITNAGRQGNGSDLSRSGNNLPSNWRDHVVGRHSADWHRDWDRRHGHFHHGHVFVFIDGFWWGLDPGFYPYYAYGSYPYDDYGYANNDYPYDYYEYSPYNYDDEQGYSPSDQDANNATVSAVQSQLAKLGYYRGVIDGVVGDQTQAALARYQEEHDLSVTGTLTAATLQSLGVRQTAS
jgi:hypothetical protein